MDQDEIARRISISPAELADLDRYIESLEEIAEWLAARGIRQWLPGTFRRDAGYYEESIRGGEVYLAQFQGALAGSLRLLRKDSIVWPEAPTGEALYVYNLAVMRQQAGIGLGVWMLDWAAIHTRSLGRTHLRLDCFADNDFLYRYYRSCGFSDCGVVDAPYPDPIGTLRLQRFEKHLTAGPAHAVISAHTVIKLEPPDSHEARRLIDELDRDLRRRYPGVPIHGLHSSDLLDPEFTFLMAWVDGRAVGCGALRNIASGVGEIKRMFVVPEFRRNGISRKLLAALEVGASDLGHEFVRLETGRGQPEAIALYKSSGYREISGFGEYVTGPYGVCFEKRIPKNSKSPV